jgi:hypothetical protein
LACLYARAFLRAYQKSISSLIINNDTNIDTLKNNDGIDEDFYTNNPMRLDNIAENMLSDIMIPQESADF